MKANRTNQLIFLAFAFALVFHHFFGYLGHFGYDDMEYARIAALLSNGVFDPNNHFSFRLTLVGLTALSYKFFGINDFASSFPSLLFSIGTLALVYRILKDESWPILTIGLALFSFNSWTFFYSDKLMPDTGLAFFVFLFFYVVYLYNYCPRKMPVMAYSFFAALALFLCFNTKETVVLIAPLIIWLIVTDIVMKRSVKFWLQFVGFGVVMLVCYMIICELLFGNAIIRFNSIIANSYLNSCSYDQQPFLITLKRITYELAKMFLVGDMLLGFIVVLSYFAVDPNYQLFKLTDRKSFFIVGIVILMFSSNFMSISVTSYNPMCLDPRHYLFIIPVAAVAAALVLREFFGQLKFRSVWFILVLLAFGISIFVGNNVGWKLYMPVLVAIGSVIFLKDSVLIPKLFAILFVAALLVQPIDTMIYSRKVDYRKQKEIVLKELIDKRQDCIVITDEVQQRLGDYYNRFSPNAACSFITYAQADTFHFQKNIKKILLNNWYTRYLSGMNDQDLPYYATIVVNPVFKDEMLKIFIFDLKIDKKERLFSTENDFESLKPFWNETPNKSNEQANSGVFSEKLGEFSVNCSVLLDSLLTDSAQQIMISPKLKIFAINSSECNLVIALDSDGKQYFWKGYDLSKYVKSKAGWWSASLNEIIERSEIQKNSKLKVYIWNNKKNEIYIDNFNVEVFAVSK